MWRWGEILASRAAFFSSPPSSLLPPLITNLTATSELEAVNTMLAAIGSAPITDLTAGQALTDVEMATERLRAATREVQSAPWQFNRRFQVPIAPTTTLAWTDADGTARTLNVFVPPSNLAGFEPSTATAQNGSLDLVIGPSVVYAPAGTMIFIDRAFNREGLIATDHPKLYIDGWYFFNFEQLPETARRYIAVLAARRFIAASTGAQELEGFTLKDEAQALRLLKRDQGDDDNYNMLDHPDVYRVLGGRPRITGNFTDPRRYR
jgi:hypothetical protein